MTSNLVVPDPYFVVSPVFRHSLSLVSVIIVGTVRLPPLCCPDAKARHALHEQLRGSASLVSNPPSDLPPGIPCTWNSRNLDLEMGNVKITRTGRGNVEERDVQVTSP